MTIILKPFSAPTVQFPQKRKTSYPQSLSYLSIKLYRHYFYIINESLISTSYFTGIILNQFTVLIECNFILLFYLLRVSIRCYCFINLMYNPFVYWLFKRTFGSNTFKLYSAFLDDVLLFQFSFRGRWSHAIFYVLRVTSLMKQHEECRRSSTMSSHPRKFQSTMRTTTTSWCSISFILIIYLTFYQNLFFSTSFCSLGFAWYRKTNCLGVTKESKNLKPLNGRS